MTDHGNVFGAYDFWKQAKDAGVNPLIGNANGLTNNQGRSMGELAGRRVQEIVSGRGTERGATETPTVDATPTEITSGEEAQGKGFFDDLLSGPQRRLESLQRSIDERIKYITGHPAFQNEVRRIERSIKKLEERLARLRRREEITPPPTEEVR